MKKLLLWSVPFKSLSAMIFAGFIILYILTGSAYSFFISEAFEYSIPFAFAIQSAALSIVMSIMCALIFSDIFIKKMRYFQRVVIFVIALLPVLALSLLLFFSVPEELTILWLIIAGMILVGIIIVSFIFETYFKMVGKQYTEILRNYKSSMI